MRFKEILNALFLPFLYFISVLFFLFFLSGCGFLKNGGGNNSWNPRARDVANKAGCSSNEITVVFESRYFGQMDVYLMHRMDHSRGETMGRAYHGPKPPREAHRKIIHNFSSARPYPVCLSKEDIPDEGFVVRVYAKGNKPPGNLNNNFFFAEGHIFRREFLLHDKWVITVEGRERPNRIDKLPL